MGIGKRVRFEESGEDFDGNVLFDDRVRRPVFEIRGLQVLP